MKYHQHQDGEWVQLKHSSHKLKCCDCGLVHRLDFKIVTGSDGQAKIQFRAFRDNRATAAARRTANRKAIDKNRK